MNKRTFFSTEANPNLFTIFIGALTIVLSTTYGYLMGLKTTHELAIFISSTTMVVFVCLFFSYKVAKQEVEKKYEEMVKKMKELLDGTMKAAEGRCLINNQLLTHYEKGADEIWVITKYLKNDIEDKDIFEAVKGNLENAKQKRIGKNLYRYFIPNPANNRTIKKNLKEYRKKFKEYEEYITFTELPDNMLFLFDEIVIYIRNEETPKRLGFTYIDIEGTGRRDQVVKIEKENVDAIHEILDSIIEVEDEKKEKLFRLALTIREEKIEQEIGELTALIAQSKPDINKLKKLKNRLQEKNLKDKAREVLKYIFDELIKP